MRKTFASIGSIALAWGLLVTLLQTSALAQYSSITTGAYNVNTTWGGSTNPANGSADTVVLNNLVYLGTSSTAALTYAQFDAVSFGSGGTGILDLRINTSGATFQVGSLDFSTGNGAITISRATSGTANSYVLNPSTVAMGNGSTLTVQNGTADSANTAGSLSINGTVTLTGSQIVSVGSNGSAVNVLTFSGAISDGSSPGSITKNGAGTLVLSNGSNTYSGGTTINTGTLSVNSAGTGNVEVGEGATLQLNLNTAVASTGSLTLDASNSLVNLTYSGFDTIAGLTVGDTVVSPGMYTTTQLDTMFAGQFSSTDGGEGFIIESSEVPEPHIAIMLMIGGLVSAGVFYVRRPKSEASL